MPKVYRIHQGGNVGSGWFASGQINSEFIDSISVEDFKGTKPTTAVPTPFARIDLVRNAFSKIAESNQINGDSDAHKLVSDALDVGEIFFNYTTHQEKLNIVRWKYDQNDQESSIFHPNNENYEGLGKTLQLFLEQDGSQYNFNEADSLYLLLYGNRVIGATSPRTLFFASVRADKLDIELNFGREENVFGESSYSLYKRDPEFVKYLVALSKKPQFSRHFPEFYEYIIKNITVIERENRSLYDEIDAITEDYLENFDELCLPNQDNVLVEPIGNFPLLLLGGGGGGIPDGSDFILLPSPNKTTEGELMPLVIPQGAFERNWIYVNDPWNNKITVPQTDPRPLDERTLPTLGTLYPNLLASDFFTPSIIRLPYALDSDKYQTISTDESLQHYLVPLTPLFFDYYSLDELDQRLTIESRAGDSVKVSLKLTTTRGEIKYTRIYSPNTDINRNNTIEEVNFTLGLMPFTRKRSNADAIEYTIAAGYPQAEKRRELEIAIHNTETNDSMSLEGVERSNRPGINYTKLFSFKKDFDTIAITLRGTTNLVFPRMVKSSGHKSFSFGIDFGTTNTHIAYQVDGEVHDFNINQHSPLISFLKAESTEVERDDNIIQINELIDAIIQETLPRIVNNDKKYPFPFRTCLLENKESISSANSHLFEDANIGFDFGVKRIKSHLEPIPYLKWAALGDENGHANINSSRIRLYIRELLLLCKWTVLREGGNVPDTKIHWSYPTSMQINRINEFGRIWRNEFEELFESTNTIERLIKIPESTAPFYFAANRLAMRVYNAPTVTIDIGGGTTDISIFENGSPKLITSFKFGGDAIFGDGFNRNIRQNGFVQQFKPIILSQLRNGVDIKKFKELNEIIDDLRDDSIVIINYLFSLENNDKVNGIALMDALRSDESFKIVFLLFYGAIIYHVAQIFKEHKLALPRNILFSGTASKSLEIIDASQDFDFINKYFKAIFKNVLGERMSSEQSTMEVFSGIEEHKQLTAKGMLFHDHSITPAVINDIKQIHSGQLKPSKASVTYKSLTKDSTIVNSVRENCSAFFELFTELKGQLDFKNNTGMTEESFAVFEKLKNEDIENYIKQGADKECNEGKNLDLAISETLFFYPMIGLLPELAYQINQK